VEHVVVWLGHGGALVESIAFNRRVVGSTPALAAMQGPWASPLPAVACALRRETPIQYPCCSRERLWVVEDLKGLYRNGRNEWMCTLRITHDSITSILMVMRNAVSSQDKQLYASGEVLSMNFESYTLCPLTRACDLELRRLEWLRGFNEFGKLLSDPCRKSNASW